MVVTLVVVRNRIVSAVSIKEHSVNPVQTNPALITTGLSFIL